MAAKKKNKCIVCGKTKNVHEYKLPHGKIYMHGNSCFRRLLYDTQGANVPIIWMGKEDIIERDHLTEEEIKGFENELIEAMDNASYEIWDDSFSETFSSMTYNAACTFEELKLRRMKKEDLPLMMGRIKYNQKLFTQLLKGEEE